MEKIFDNVLCLTGSVRCGVLISEDAAVLIDAPELPGGKSLLQVLAACGVRRVERVFLTQHRRAHCGGLFAWQGERPAVCATAQEARFLAAAGEHWARNGGKYHRYECLPDQFLPFENLTVDHILSDGEAVRWREFTITPIVFGALSPGDCAYVVQSQAGCVVFCGALAMAGGKIHALYPMHTAIANMMGYHSFLGGLPAWRRGMARVLAQQPQLLIPAYGEPEPHVAACLRTLDDRLLSYAEAYDRISAVRWYFPDEFRTGFELPLGIDRTSWRCRRAAHPGWLSRIGETTSYLLRAPSGRAILIDAGDAAAIEAAAQMLQCGEITSLDACWITHAHDDHLNAMWLLTQRFDCPVLSSATVAEVCRNPAAWFLPALPDCNGKLRAVPDGACWQWEGFTLTAMNLPGQCIAHAGLLAEKDGLRVLLCGDSFAPTGLDDYCAYNRNLPGAGRGYRYCVELLERYGVHQLVNEHQTEPFAYSPDDLAFLKAGMDAREACLAALLPDDIGLGLDSQWLRCFPAEQTVTAGAVLRLSLQVTSHGEHTVRAAARLPWSDARPEVNLETAGHSSGSTEFSTSLCPADGWAHLDVQLPERLHGAFIIPFDCWLDGRYLGTFTHAFVTVV